MSATEHIRRKKAALHALLANWSGKLEDQAKANAPWIDRTSHARQSIHSGVEDRGSQMVLYLSHGMQYGRWLEQGTGLYGPRHEKYTIRPKNGRFLRFMGPNGPIFARKVIHPGIKARPIIKPTVEANLSKIRSSVRRLLRRD